LDVHDLNFWEPIGKINIYVTSEISTLDWLKNHKKYCKNKYYSRNFVNDPEKF
jgi:hypothetical protein